MKLAFTPAAWDDYVWFTEHDRKLLKRINSLLKEALRTPFTGTGKPEPLKGELAGCWSRRIDHEHRLVLHGHDGLLDCDRLQVSL